MNLKKSLTILFFAIATLRVVIPVITNIGKFTERFDPVLYEKKYNASQYMVPQSKQPISDEELLSHAGYRYIKGTNPILINSDHPPLGKYIIGLFTVVTGNNRTVSLFFALLNILLVSVIVYTLTQSVFFISAAVLFVAFDPMFVDQIIHSPILDIIQVSFLLLYILLFIQWNKNKQAHYIVLMSIMLGFLSSVKLYFPAIIVTGVTVLTLLVTQKPITDTVVYILVTLPLAFITYAATYFKYFIESKALLPFFGVQKWIFLFWQNNSVNQAKVFGGVIPFVLLNKWYVWWGDKPYIPYSGWTPVWPIFFVAGLCSSCLTLYYVFRPLAKKKNHSAVSVFLSIWFLVFTLYLCFVPISPRYLMMLYFPTYILVILSVYHQFMKNAPHAKKHI